MYSLNISIYYKCKYHKYYICNQKNIRIFACCFTNVNASVTCYNLFIV